MNDVERLRGRLGERFPSAALSMDPAETPSGSWWLDVESQGHRVVVEWRPRAGFGISTPSRDDFGAGADEIYPDEDAAFERVGELLLGRMRTATAGSHKGT
jgi:hypothetical protein